MPIYPWKCGSCEKITDSVQTIADIDVPPTKCDHCESTEFTERTIVRPDNCKGYILNGRGWHHTEYTKNRPVN